ncbi:MAG: hypothetical protein R2713_21820 [Ilumatobacteraceae bacterium]
MYEVSDSTLDVLFQAADQVESRRDRSTLLRAARALPEYSWPDRPTRRPGRAKGPVTCQHQSRELLKWSQAQGQAPPLSASAPMPSAAESPEPAGVLADVSEAPSNTTEEARRPQSTTAAPQPAPAAIAAIADLSQRLLVVVEMAGGNGQDVDGGALRRRRPTTTSAVPPRSPRATC